MKEKTIAWWKTILIAFIVYWAIFALGFLLFVCFGLGYQIPTIANTFAHIMALPGGTGKNYNITTSAIFWTAIISILTKIINWVIVNSKNKNV